MTGSESHLVRGSPAPAPTATKSLPQRKIHRRPMHQTDKPDRERRRTMRNQCRKIVATLLVALGVAMFGTPAVYAQEKKPNILFIMGDDIGWFNIGAYHQGIMAGRTPNLDKLASEGMRFTDYYAE